jgi:hypothetical protein
VILVLFTEYPGKQDFLQLSNISHAPEQLYETGHNPYNFAGHFRTRLLWFELLFE